VFGGVPDETVDTSEVVRRRSALPVRIFTRQGWRLELLGECCAVARAVSRRVRGIG
jgi:hypothetical protein